MMKENRKLMREILKDVRRDMTDEEVLNLLADSKISENLPGKHTPWVSERQIPLPGLPEAGPLSSPLPGCWYCGW